LLHRIARCAAGTALLTQVLSSCTSTKQVVYFQGDSAQVTRTPIVPPVVPRVKPGDVLAVTVSSLSEESNQVFNIPNQLALTYTNFPGSTGGGIARQQPWGYQVDSAGRVEMPLIGRVRIQDLTPSEAADTLRGRLLQYLKEPAVNVRFLNHKFSIIGEVNRPATYNLLSDRVSLPEALSNAGDLTIYGRRDNVMVIREQKGTREIARLNLNTREAFASPYYYLRDGDVIYVEPTKGKVTFTDRSVQLIPVIASVLTAMGVLILNLRR
jgi:polysaccharide export outer membrane protein